MVDLVNVEKTRKAGEYYGIRHKTYQFSDIHMSQYSYKEPNTPEHFHEHPYLWYVLEGNMVDNSKKGQKLLPAGSLLLINWEDLHYNEKQSTHAAGFHIEIDRNYFTSQDIDLPWIEGNVLLNHPDIHHLVGRLYYEFKTADTYTPLSIEMILYQLGVELSSHRYSSHSSKPAWIDRLTEILYHQDETISLKGLAAELGVHPVHICRTIPQYFENGLGDFYRKRKIQMSMKHFHDTEMSLTHIAHEVGCYDQSHFTRLFKRFMGTTPSAYRKALLS